MAEILLSKLMPPENNPSLLYRGRLVEVLQNEYTPNIIVITAPAGYGKTVLAFQLCQESNKPLVWIHLDKRDNDPTHFLQFIIKGLQQHWPDICSRIIQLIGQTETIVKQPLFIATLLINDLISSGTNPVIVLDDYHEITVPFIHTITQEILDHLPSDVTMIITSRTAVPLSLSRQYVSGKARLINAAELNFTGPEIAGFINSQYGTQPVEVINKIEHYTGGWPAALILTGTLLPEGFDDFTYSSPVTLSLYNYLASEVLEKLPRSYQKFLIETSVLKVLRPDHCNLLLDCNNSGEILKTLSEKILLLSALGEEQNTYCCHQLLRDFLLERLGDKKYILYKHAGRLSQLKGNTVKAVEAFLKAEIDEETISALETGGKECLASGHWQTLSHWLEQLPDSLKKASPWLSYFESAVNTYKGQIGTAELWIPRAIEAFRLTGDRIGLAECCLLQARLLRFHGNYKDSLNLIDQAESEFQLAKARPRFDLLLEKGLSLALSGKLKSAETLICKALEDAKQSNQALAVAHLAETLGLLHYQQGRHAQALKTYWEAIKFSPDNTLPNYYIQDAIPYIYRDWGEISKALEWAEKSIAAKERYRMTETLPSAYCALSYIYFELNDFIKVEELISKALKLQYEYGSERYFLLLNQALLAWCRFARGHWVDARQLLDSTLTVAEEQTDLACGLAQMLIGTVHALMGNLLEAHQVLHRSEINLKAMNFVTRLCEAYKALAYVHYALGEVKQFQSYARRFLHMGAKLNFVGNAVEPTADLLEPIIRFGLEYDVEIIYTQSILIRMKEAAHRILVDLAGHPNPAVRARLIAPLAELSDEEALDIVRKLSKDRCEKVSVPALASIKYTFIDKNLTLPAESIAGKPTAALNAKLFGTFQVFTGNREIIGWRTRKSRELLALMLHMETPPGKERLMEELWQDADPANSSSLFRTTMHYLRKQLDQEGLANLIKYRQDSYYLDKERCLLDCKNFEKLVTTGLQEEPLQVLGAGMLSKAIRLYRGDYLSEEIDYNWAVPRQIRLKHLYTEALLSLARYYRSRAKHEKARQNLMLLKEAEPLCEPAHRLLMQVYASLGERHAMADEMKRFGLMLQEEVGLPPTPETRELYRQLGCLI